MPRRVVHCRHGVDIQYLSIRQDLEPRLARPAPTLDHMPRARKKKPGKTETLGDRIRKFRFAKG